MASKNKKIKDVKFLNQIEKLILKDNYLKHFNIDKKKEEEEEILIEEKRLKWLNEKIYKLKENLLYNNLSTDYLHDLNLSNLSYYKTYFEIFKNFDSEDYSNLILLRMNFLEYIIEKYKDVEEIKSIISDGLISEDLDSNEMLYDKSILKNEKEDYQVDESKKIIFYQIFSTISSLFSVILLYDFRKNERSKTKEEIILCLFDNLNIQTEKVNFYSVYKMKELEKNIHLLINIFQQNLLFNTKDKDQPSLQNHELTYDEKSFESYDYFNFLANILEKLLSITARLNAFTGFLKILFILKENKLALKNYDHMIENILNPKIRSFLKPVDEKYFICEKEIILEDYFCNCDIIKMQILTCENNIYLQSIILRDKKDLLLNLVKFDKDLAKKRMDNGNNKVYDIKNFFLKDYLKCEILVKIREEIKKNSAKYENIENNIEAYNNIANTINSEIKIKAILPNKNKYMFILLNQNNSEANIIFKISKKDFTLTDTINLESVNLYQTFNIFTSRDCFYFLKKQIIDEEKEFNHEKLDIFDSETKQKSDTFIFEKLDFSNETSSYDSQLNNSYFKEEYKQQAIKFDFSKLDNSDTGKGNTKEKKNYSDYSTIKKFIEFCKEDLDKKYASMAYLNNKIIFYKKSTNKVKNFYNVDLNGFFQQNQNVTDLTTIYQNICKNDCFTEIEINNEKDIEIFEELFYDTTSNLIFALKSIEKKKCETENIENYKFHTLIIKYGIYYNTNSFPVLDNGIHDLINNNRIYEAKISLDNILEIGENKQNAANDLNLNFKNVNLNLVKNYSSDFMNIDCTNEILLAKLENANNLLKEAIQENKSKELYEKQSLLNKDLMKDFQQYKNFSTIFIKNSDADLQNIYDKEAKISISKNNLRFVNGNEIASELYFEIAFRSLTRYIINNSNVISTLKIVKNLNKSVYDNFLKNSYPKFVYYFGKNASEELFQILWQKNFIAISENPELLFNANEAEIFLLDLILIENLFSNFKCLKLGSFENYFDVKNLRSFSLMLVNICNLRLNNKKYNTFSPINENIKSLHNAIFNYTIKILVVLLNNIKNHSYIFNVSTFDELAFGFMDKMQAINFDFCDTNSYLFYFVTLFLNTKETNSEKKLQIVDLILKSEINFIQKINLENLQKSHKSTTLTIKNKSFEKCFNNLIFYLISQLSNSENIENYNNPESTEMKIINVLNENLVNLICELKKISKNLLQEEEFKKYIKNFSLILNCNFIIFNLIFRIFNNEYNKITSIFSNQRNQKNENLNINFYGSQDENSYLLSKEDNKNFYKLLKDERKSIPFLLMEKITLLIFHLNDLDANLIELKEKNINGLLYDLISDKVYICDSEHAQNIKNKNIYSFEFSDKNNKYLKFDYLSRIFNKSNIELQAVYNEKSGVEPNQNADKFSSGLPVKDIINSNSSVNINNSLRRMSYESIFIEENSDNDNEGNINNEINSNPNNFDKSKNIFDDKNKHELDMNSGYLNSQYMQMKNSQNLKCLNFKYELDHKFEEFINNDNSNNNYVDENFKFYGFKFKIFNFEDPNMIDDYLIKNLKRLLIFLSCKIFDLILLSPELYDSSSNVTKKQSNVSLYRNASTANLHSKNFKAEEKFYQEVFTSKLFNNISLINYDFIQDEISKQELNEHEEKNININPDNINQFVRKSFIFSHLERILDLFKGLNKNLKYKNIDLFDFLNNNSGSKINKATNNDNSKDNSNETNNNSLNLEFFCNLEKLQKNFYDDILDESKDEIKLKEAEIIDLMIKLEKEAFEIGIKSIQKFFILKNPWGKVGGKLIDRMIYMLFITVLKFSNLLLSYDSFINKIESILNTKAEKKKDLITIDENAEKTISQTLNNIIMSLPNFSLFLKIYTECSKLRSWLNEKKMYFTDVASKTYNASISTNLKHSESARKIIEETNANNVEEENSIVIDTTITKDEVNIKEKEKEKEDYKFEQYIDNLINNKIYFLFAINNKKPCARNTNTRDNDLIKSNSRLEILSFNKEIQEIIDSIFTFLKSDNLQTDLIIRKINYQNAKALNKEAFLILFNFIISILKNQCEIQDLLYWLNTKFKDTEFIIDFNRDLFGSDPKITKRVYMHFYNFIFLLIQKLKLNENLCEKQYLLENNEDDTNNKNTSFTKSSLSTVNLINIFQSLIWKIKKSDFEYYKLSGFFDIFSGKGIVSNILNFTLNQDKNITNLKDLENQSNDINSENIDSYGKYCFDIQYLQNFIFDSFAMFSLQIINKFHLKNYTEEEDIYHISTQKSEEGFDNSQNRAPFSLKLNKKSILSAHEEEFIVIDIISKILVTELNKYVYNWRAFIQIKSDKKKSENDIEENLIPYLSEEKLNSYLILIYRCLSFNSQLIEHFTLNYPDLFPVILEIFLYANEKNKILIIKFIELFIRFYKENSLDECIVKFIENTKNIFFDLILVVLQQMDLNSITRNFLQESSFKYEVFKKIKQEKNLENHFGIKFLFEFIFTLIKAMLNTNKNISKKVKFFKTTSDKEIAFVLINLIRNILKKNNFDSSSLIKDFLLEKIKNNFFTNPNNAQNTVQASDHENYKITDKDDKLIEIDNLQNKLIPNLKESDYSEKSLLLLILGIELCPLRVGQKVAFEQVFREKDIHAYDIFEYSFVSAKTKLKNISNKNDKPNKKDDYIASSLDIESDHLRLGVIVGFTNSSNNPFTTDVSMNEFSYENLSYTPDKKYAVVVVEETLNKNNMKSLNFETVVIDVEKLIIKKENPIDDISLRSLIVHSGIQKWMMNYLINDVKHENNDKFRYLCLNFLVNMILAKDLQRENLSQDQIIRDEKQNIHSEKISFISDLKDLNQNDLKKLIGNLEEFSLLSLQAKIRACTLEKLENDNIYDLLADSEEDNLDELINQNVENITSNQTAKRKNSFNDKFNFLGLYSKKINSFCIKYCGNLIKEFEVDFVYNSHKFSLDERNKYYHIVSLEDFFNYDLSQDDKFKYILVCNSEDLFSRLITNEKNKKLKNLNFIKYIMTDNSIIDNTNFNKNFDESYDYFGQIPTLVVNQLDFIKISSFVFEGNMDEDFSYLLGCPMDFSSFIEIPSYLVDESVQYGQRDLLLKILGESQPKEKQIKAEKNIYKDYSIKKLISLISRRIMLMLMSSFAEIKKYPKITNIIKIFKLTLLENNIGKILNIRNWFYPKNDSIEDLEKCAIEYNLRISPTFLIKNFLNNLSEDNKEDKIIIKNLLQLDIFEKNNFIDEYLIANIKTEDELLKFEIFENDLKIIFSILENEKLNFFNKNENEINLQDEADNIFQDYYMKLIHVLAINSEDISRKNPKIGEFAIDAINTIFTKINDLLESDKFNKEAKQINLMAKTEDEKLDRKIILTENKTLNYIISSLDKFKFFFTSSEFYKFYDRVNECLNPKLQNDRENINQNNNREITNLDLKIINLLISIYDMIFTLYIRYDFDLNIENFLSRKFLDIYFSYSLLNNKLDKYEILVLFKMRHELCLNSDAKNRIKMLLNKLDQTIEFNHYFSDKNSRIAHLMKFEFPQAEDISLKISKIDQTYFHPEQISMIYSKYGNEENANSFKLEFQDYINSYDLKKEYLIRNKFNNNIYISLPHGNFKTNLFNFGSNEKQSLGCGHNSENTFFPTPSPAIGIESKLIRSFKFGYYHIFAVTTDNKVWLHGREIASGSKNLNSNSSLGTFNLENHFNDIAQEHQIQNIWVNNFNTTVMLTKDNQIYGCGKNTDGILCNLTNLDGDVTVPAKLPDLPNSEKIKILACGYKSMMILTENHNLYSIGCNSFYECGNRESTAIVRDYFKVNIPNGIKIIDVVAGENYFLFLGKDEVYKKIRLYAIGNNLSGQCGMNNDRSGKFNLCHGTETIEFKLLSSRNSSSAAISRKGELFTFGCNEMWNIGHDDSQIILRPKKLKFLETNNLIADEVSVSHNHMLIICRDVNTGIRKLYSCGTHEYGCLGYERSLNSSNFVINPQEVTYFSYEENAYKKSREIIPLKVSTSRYQSFVLGLMTKFENDLIEFDKECKICKNKIIGGAMYFQKLPEIGIKENIIIQNENDSIDNSQREKKENNPDKKIENKALNFDSANDENLINIEVNVFENKKERVDFLCEVCCSKIKNNQIKKFVESRKNSSANAENPFSESERQQNDSQAIKESSATIKFDEKANEKSSSKMDLFEIENEYLSKLNSDVSDLLYYVITPFEKSIKTSVFESYVKSRSDFESILVDNYYKINLDQPNNDIMDVVFVNFDKHKDDNDKEKEHYEKKLNDEYIYECINCNSKLNENFNQVFISTENENLILCRYCTLNNPNCIRFPQAFYCFNKYRIHKNYLKYIYKVNFSEIIYDVKNSEKPYLVINIKRKISDVNRLDVYKQSEVYENFYEYAQKFNEDLILEFNDLNDNKELKATNALLTSSDLFNYVKKSENHEGEFSKLNKLELNDFKVLERLSSAMNESIVMLSQINSNSNENNFIQKVISKNLNYIQPSKRLSILWEKISRLRKSVNPNETAITLNRMKAIRFYEKGVPDTNGENTIFKQLYSKMKKFPIKNYLCEKNDRLFRVYFKGEGASDMGGPYRDLFSNISEELQSDYLDLFIKTPNNKNDIGNLRDKYIPNPSAKSSSHQELYYFLGCLIASAIASGQMLSLNLHPIVWKMMLNRKINFSEFESVDKHFFKIITDLEKAEEKIKTEEEFAEVFDLNFTILLSDKTELEIIPNGKRTRVTLENKNKYVLLAKTERLREFKSQVESIRYGLM